MALIGFSSYCTLKLVSQGHSPASSLAWIPLLPQPPISMNHKILTNQIMPSLTEGYLSTCPFLSLSALSLSHPAIKNLLARSLLSVWSLWGLHAILLLLYYSLLSLFPQVPQSSYTVTNMFYNWVCIWLSLFCIYVYLWIYQVWEKICIFCVSDSG
jgi:hypothetical protein